MCTINHKGPLHVLWQVSFSFWVTWSNSSWQQNYKSVFFKLQFLNDKLQLYPKKLNCFGHFITQKFEILKSKQFFHFFWWEVNLRGLTKFIFAESSGLRPERQKKKVPLLITQFWKKDTIVILFSAWNRSRDSKAKRNLSNHM